MTEVGNRAIIDAYFQCMNAHDHEGLSRLLHGEFVGEYPQSGELIRGPANVVAIGKNYPNGTPAIETLRITGSQDKWVLTPMWTVTKITGSGDNYTAEGLLKYADGSVWHAVDVLELRDGKILRSTQYFGAPFEAPEWRSQWVEPIQG